MQFSASILGSFVNWSSLPGHKVIGTAKEVGKRRQFRNLAWLKGLSADWEISRRCCEIAAVIDVEFSKYSVFDVRILFQDPLSNQYVIA